MSEIQLLDCTLRDGGYVNDWEFGHDNLVRIYERLLDSGVDIIELGFLDDRRPFDLNRSIFPNTASIREIWGETAGMTARLGQLGLGREGVGPSKARSAHLTAMIDYGTCDIKNIEPAETSFVDTIRVIFKEHLMKEALDYCAELKNKGYLVCAQLVSVTTYTEESLKRLIEIVNRIEPFALSMVDTYGLLDPSKLLWINRIIDSCLSEKVKIGFHAHNNLQLAYANSMAFLASGNRHDMIVDGTLYGMGKSAGNAPLELLSMHLNQNYGKSYEIAPMLEAIEESLMDFYLKSPWGYKMNFYLSARNKCHPSYVRDFSSKQNLSISMLDKALSEIEPDEKKLLYDREASARAYRDFRESVFDDEASLEELKEKIAGRKVLLLGPGKNVRLQRQRIEDFIEKNAPFVISINFVPEKLRPDFVFVTKTNRYREMEPLLLQKEAAGSKSGMAPGIMITSNVACISGKNPILFEKSLLLEETAQMRDNPFLMLLKILRKIGVMRVSCAGFDGYSSREDNYLNPGMEYSFIKENASSMNRDIRSALRRGFSDMEIEFVTYSQYQAEEDSLYAGF
ncbi:MAG: aldolase catalytic domain-containing protein [Lachnospiraceae bacterium]|nr:aldolase catalytic domain-containing protein [Lachnospiraceae bacterium]